LSRARPNLQKKLQEEEKMRKSKNNLALSTQQQDTHRTIEKQQQGITLIDY